MFQYFDDVMAESDFQSFQAMQNDSNVEDVRAMVRCIRLDLDCADVCLTTGRMLSRQTEPDMSVVARQLEACIAACRSCGAECDKHAPHMAHCQACAAACHNCEQACQRLAQDAMASAR